MGSIRDLILSFEAALQSFGLDIPAWVIPVVLVAIAASVFPMFTRANNSVRARGLLSRARLAAGQDRLEMEQEALEMVKDDPEGLAVVASASIQYGRVQLAEEALAQLKATGKRTSDLKRLETLLHGPAPISPEAEAIAIRNMLENGLREKARERLKRALSTFPSDPDLQDIEKNFEGMISNNSPTVGESD